MPSCRPTTRLRDLNPSDLLWPAAPVQQARDELLPVGRKPSSQFADRHPIDARTAPVRLHSLVGPVQVLRLTDPLHQGVRRQGSIPLRRRRRLPLRCGRRSASGLSASQGAHCGPLPEQRELVRHAFPRLHAHRVIRSVSPHQEVPPFPARPGPVLWGLLTPPCPSIVIADAVVPGFDRTGPEASQGKPRLFPAIPAGFTPTASG